MEGIVCISKKHFPTVHKPSIFKQTYKETKYAIVRNEERTYLHASLGACKDCVSLLHRISFLANC